MQWKKITCIVGILTILLELSTSAEGMGAQNEPAIHKQDSSKQVTVVSIPSLSFLELRSEQLAKLPYFRQVTEKGGIGAMNIRTANRGMRDVYLSLGAGEPSVGIADVQAFAAKESWRGAPILDVRKRYVGSNIGEASPRSEADLLIVPDIVRLQRLNRKLTYGPGLLGSLLKEYGIHRSVIGNSDWGKRTTIEEDKTRRYSPMMLMDSDGYVDSGFIGNEIMTSAVDRPYGIATAYAQLLALGGKSEKPSLQLIELADLNRLYADKAHYSEARFDELKGQILKEMDEWLGQRIARMTDRESIWIFSPEVHSEAAKSKAYLSPLLHYTVDSQAGILVSDSTRRPGVVTASDFTSTLIDEFNIPLPSGLNGIPLSTMRKANALAGLEKELSSMQTIYRSRPLLLYPFVTCEMVVLLVGLLYVLWMKKKAADSQRAEEWKGAMPGRKVVHTLLYSLLVAPAVMLLLGLLVLPLTNALGVEGAILWMIVLFIVGCLLCSIFLEKWPLSSGMIWLAYGTVWLLMVDVCTGSHAMKYSLLGYDPMIGARYYGIGNEYMGVLIGALVLAVTAALQRRHDALSPALRGRGLGAVTVRAAAPIACFLLVTGCLAAPSLGANAGGALSAAVAFGVAGVYCFAGERWRELRLGRGAALLTVLLALGFGALWLLNSADSPAAAARESHVGRAFHALRAGQLDQIGHLIERKLRMNVHLLRASAWSKVLITSLFVMAVLVLRPSGRLRVWQNKNPYWMYGFSANMIGAIAALLLNDSGIVAAATMIIFVAVPMLLLRLQELEAEIETGPQIQQQ
ncbi:hypothetical protein HQN90_10945 [Paenibacillus alba]|uniref:hypothetical protein n=1 Tax=Paenibacillus alba TaxID=1197127 RepID=UPI0015675F09|nr:hypothetical protein [Paenibacillus alba]NQX66643.1 hypothetical protein [Paenibacillus alba]